MVDVAQALAQARALGVDRLDAQLLLAHATGRTRSWVLAHDDAELGAEAFQALQALLARRAAGEPLAYLTGAKEFHGLHLRMTPDVLVPRPETETLVDWALECLARRAPGSTQPRVLDLGTGSGAIALALAQGWPAACVCAVDASTPALNVARANAERLGLAVEWLAGDWWSAVPARRFDLVVSNPPYVAEGDPHLAALHHEPRLALCAGFDGLDAIRAIAASAREHLDADAWLLFEHGHEQAPAVQELLRAAGLRDVQTRADLAGHPRCTGARR